MKGVWQNGLKIGAVGCEGNGTIGPSVNLNGSMYHITAKHIFPDHMHDMISHSSMDYCYVLSNCCESMKPVELWDKDLYDPVTKVGSATGRTTGYIDQVSGRHAKIRSFDVFAEPGDSGAAVVTVRSGQLVGILVGGTKSYWDVLLASEIQADCPHNTLNWFLYNP